MPIRPASDHPAEREILGGRCRQENVKVVLEAVEAFNRRDADAFVATTSADIEWEDTSRLEEIPPR